MIEYERYLPDILAEVDDCPEIVAVEKVRDALMELCRRSTIWRTEMLPFAISATVADYELIFDDGQQLAQVNYVTLVDSNDEEIHPRETTEDEQDAKSVKGWRLRTGSPRAFYMKDPEVLRLVPIPEEAYTAYVGVILQPTPDSYEAPDWLYNQYHEIVAKGARAKLLNMRGRPWYDPNKAALEMQDFYDEVRNVQNAATRSHTRTQKRVAMRPIA